KLETRIAARTHDELDYLTGSFNQFMEQIQQLISDLKVQEGNLFRATAKAEESDRLKTQFLGNISHELRTPLYAIVGFSQLLDDPDLDNDTRRLYISRINLNNDRLLSFVEDIMTFSKLELSQLTVSNEIFQLEELLEEIESHYNNFFAVQPKPLELIVRKRFAGYGLEICSDRSLLKKIITVLLDNAYKFSNGGVVTLSYVVADSFYRIYVKDAGVGIPLQYQKLIFNKFYQYQPNDKVVYGGSGLGLALAKGIAVLLGGVINVRSVVGKGSVFCVTFPR
nr:HAMP domain-containing histidine kinase [Breznakibacter sp.]